MESPQVWVAYRKDLSILRLFPDELSCLRYAVEERAQTVGFALCPTDTGHDMAEMIGRL